MEKRAEEMELLRRVREWFDAPERIQHYQREFPSGLTRAEEWLLLQVLPANGRILDLGCGVGRATIAVARRGLDAVGIDVSPHLVEAARAVAAPTGFSPHFLCVDGLYLPFEDGSFDGALAFKVYGYLPSRSRRLAYLEEVFRVLRPGASLLLTSYVVPTEMFGSYADDELHASVAALFTSLEPGDTFCAGQGFVHWFTEETLQEELSQSSFNLDVFCSDEPFGGAGLIRLACLKKVMDT